MTRLELLIAGFLAAIATGTIVGFLVGADADEDCDRLEAQRDFARRERDDALLVLDQIERIVGRAA